MRTGCSSYDRASTFLRLTNRFTMAQVIPSLLVRLPQLQGPGYHLDVKSVCRTVGRTDCPSLTA